MVSPNGQDKHGELRPPDVDPLDFYKPDTVAPSAPDPRDYQAAEHDPALRAAGEVVALPASFRMPNDDRDGLAEDQGGIGSCAAFQATGMFETAARIAGRTYLDPSEKAQYGLSRDPRFNGGQNWLGQDTGSVPRVHMQLLQKVGVFDEARYPYLPYDLSFTVPQAECDANPPDRRIDKYYTVGSIDEAKRVIFGTNGMDGHDVAACFVLSHNFRPDGAGNIPHPAGGEWGGHAIRWRGWDDGRQMPCGHVGAGWFLNQWNRSWGQNGYCWICYQHLMLPMGKGGMWWGDAWVALITSAPRPQPNPVPQIRAFAPAEVPATTPTILQVSGAGFAPGAIASLGRQTVPASVQDAGTLVASLPALTAGSYSFQVVNPPPGGGMSNSVVVPVAAPRPSPTRRITVPAFVSDDGGRHWMWLSQQVCDQRADMLCAYAIVSDTGEGTGQTLHGDWQFFDPAAGTVAALPDAIEPPELLYPEGDDA